MFKEDLALNNQQRLICHKTQSNQTVFTELIQHRISTMYFFTYIFTLVVFTDKK